ncbi:helix-turn-helix transcriptional regulator [Nitratireductor sp. OM-1]|uniref:helix-turn-helix domain-containing protein n=1 Tax=Nitratireductor sp. OM-1 TaxID=1756988 RepID=UPI000DDC515C|nr:helix-turn-helix transcriptional regulator [Nitratireductor sp. OM-1]
MDGNFWGALIRALREEQGISQRTLAAATGVNRSTLRKIESGETSGDIRVMETLLSHLGYELEAIQQKLKAEGFRFDSRDAFSADRRSRLAAARVLTISLG